MNIIERVWYFFIDKTQLFHQANGILSSGTLNELAYITLYENFKHGETVSRDDLLDEIEFKFRFDVEVGINDAIFKSRYPVTISNSAGYQIKLSNGNADTAKKRILNKSKSYLYLTRVITEKRVMFVIGGIGIPILSILIYNNCY